jgi:hypothetical protein
MAILQPGLPKSYQLSPGETLTIVTDAASICRYGQLILPPPGSAASGEQPLGIPISVPSSSAITVGPRADVSRWLIDGIIGPGCSVVQNPMQSVPDSGAPPDVMHLFGSGAPTGATGQNSAAIGSLYTDVTNAQIYLQGGSKAAPVWKQLTRAA